ncbi:uncharacterized protein LOC114746175 [Neltuma alba]|uniref:uncharacterized protein LOC114746175 n=1 Tax=Neltuma alba TaxID=207710 RepID=UPI0010A547C4|nr:uncharacterized protein LOC114746175 [Prosopis alba]
MASLHLLPPLSKFCSSLAPLPRRYSQRVSSLPSLSFTAGARPFVSKSFVIRFALTESDSPKSLEPDPRSLLQEIADSFDLPRDYFAQLPRDLRLDLNDAAFDLSNGPIVDEVSNGYCCHNYQDFPS